MLKPVTELLALISTSGSNSNATSSNPHLITLRNARKCYWEGDNAITREEIGGYVNLLISSPTIDHSFWERPDCKFTISQAIGCTGCNRASRVILSPLDVMRPGIVPISSNCSLSQQYLSCQIQPFSILVKGTPSVCTIYLDVDKKKNTKDEILPSNSTSNRTNDNSIITFHIDYIFEGNIDEIQILQITTTDPDIMTKAGIFLSNKNFQIGLGVTFLASTGIFTVFKLLTRGLAIYLGKRVSSDRRDKD